MAMRGCSSRFRRRRHALHHRLGEVGEGLPLVRAHGGGEFGQLVQECAAIWPCLPAQMISPCVAGRMAERSGKLGDGGGRLRAIDHLAFKGGGQRIEYRVRDRGSASPLRASSFRQAGLRDAAGPDRMRGPRSAASSSSLITSLSASGVRPSRAQGCFSMASSVHRFGWIERPARQQQQRTRRSACRCSGMPEEGEISRPQRSMIADTRRASEFSGVTSAAVLPGVSSVSRSSRAAASASSPSSSASTSDRPSRPAVTSSSADPGLGQSLQPLVPAAAFRRRAPAPR